MPPKARRRFSGVKVVSVGTGPGDSGSQKIYEKLYEMKVVEDVKSKIKVTEKAVSAEEFAKLAKEI